MDDVRTDGAEPGSGRQAVPDELGTRTRSRAVIDLDGEPARAPADDRFAAEQEWHLREELAREKARADDLDSRLGYALLTIGELRGTLRRHGLAPDTVFGDDRHLAPPRPPLQDES